MHVPNTSLIYLTNSEHVQEALTWEDYFLNCRLASTQQDNHDLVPRNMQSAAGEKKKKKLCMNHYNFQNVYMKVIDTILCKL